MSLTNSKHTMIFVFSICVAFLVVIFKMMVMYYVSCGWVNTVFNTADHTLVCISPAIFKLYLVIWTWLFMAEQMFMFATTAGFMIGLGVLLFVVRGRRSKGVKATISGHDVSDKGRKAKRYDSDGKPIYE